MVVIHPKAEVDVAILTGGGGKKQDLIMITGGMGIIKL